MTPARADRAVIAPASALVVLCAAAYTVLGLAVAPHPPRGIDLAARAVAGEAPRLAWIFTASCLWPALTVLGVCGTIVATRNRAWRGRIVFAIVTTLVSWQVSNALKELFMRPRPAYWIIHHETSYSYSSGHAMFAVLVYGLWAYHASQTALPTVPRAVLTVLLAAWGAAVIWSRLALGAHYPSDLAGGVLLAVGMLGLARLIAGAVVPRARVL